MHCSLRHLSSYYKRLTALMRKSQHFQLSGSSLSRKHGLDTFVHEQQRYTFLDQSPSKLEIEWLCMYVDGYKIVNVYKPPPTRLRSLDLPVFPHPCLYDGNFNCCHVDWSYDNNVRTVSAWLAGQVLMTLPFYGLSTKDAASFTLAAGTLTLIQI